MNKLTISKKTHSSDFLGNSSCKKGLADFGRSLAASANPSGENSPEMYLLGMRIV